MIIKHIFLSALLIVPLGVQASNAVRSRADIIAELENLNAKIAEKEAIINAIVDNMRIVFREVYDIKTERSYIKVLTEEMEQYGQNLLAAPLTSENITKFLAYEFINDDRDSINRNKDQVRRIKFAMFRCKIEYSELNELFNQYQKCMNELAQIEK